MRVPKVVLLTDRSQLQLGRALVRTVRECVDAGLEWVVVREHDLGAEARHALVEALAGIPSLTTITSRIPDPAAHGLHAGGSQAAPAAGPWGRSCHSRADVARAAQEGARWVTLSPYAASASKPGHGPALADGDLESHPAPVLALGGIDPGNAADALAAGAHGVAVMGAVMRADEPADVVARLLEATR
ncbi:thiamine phosphate synthase [Nocardioides gansuensis]|uniref:Thiamine phosphate synthase n=1 Tax=Nocardioides gansuensis TaxID=2138300 RepID=A0A2T8F7E3_9ACTN|nr:thiamine phosphate synthase [Nocardioides gansuensis]PVG81636.1 thiamine phosphate synthase [Nocardioides gansuensis]